MERCWSATTTRVESANYESIKRELPLTRTTEGSIFFVVFFEDQLDCVSFEL